MRNPWEGEIRYEAVIECGLSCRAIEYPTRHNRVAEYLRANGWHFIRTAHADGREIGWTCPDCYNRYKEEHK